MNKVLSVILSRILGILVFLILLAVANNLNFDEPVFDLVINFLNNNLLIILLFSVLFFFAELFEVFIFPFNIIYPLFNAFGAIFLIEFLKRMLLLFGIDYPFNMLQLIITPIVFIIVLILGYVKIIRNLMREEKRKVKPNKKSKKILDAMNEFFNKVHNIINGKA